MAIIDYAAKLADFRAKLNALRNTQVPVWEMERVAEFVAWAVTQLSPLQVGDVAELLVTPEITEKKAWGWLSAKHILVSGRRGKVLEVDWRDGCWCYLWEPFDQTWFSQVDHLERAVDRPSGYQFWGCDLAKVESFPKPQPNEQADDEQGQGDDAEGAT